MSSQISAAVQPSGQSSSKPRPVVTKVVEDIYQVTIPLPFRLNHIHSYLLRSAQGWTIVDFGLNWPEAHKAWQAAFSALNISSKDVAQLFLTHMHPDHFGMAGWFQEWTGHAVACSAITQEQIQRVWVNHAWEPTKIADWWESFGIPGNVGDKALDNAAAMRGNTHPHPAKFETIEAGATMQFGDRSFETIHAPGHAEGQLLLYDRDDKLLLSGDHVLMKITPNIGLWPTGSLDPLDKYLTSLRSLKEMDVRIGLPGHMQLIDDWSGRIEEIIEHHDHRLTQTLEAVESPSTGYDVCQALFPVDNLSPHEVRFAAAEAMAHVVYLVGQGKMTQVSEQDAAVAYYQRA